MNATLFVMSSALALGGDVTPAGWGDPPPAAVRGQGCTNCGPAQGPVVPAPCDPCGKSRPRLLDRLKNRFGKSADCCPPAPIPVTAPPCGTCTTPKHSQPNLLDRLRARHAARKGSPGCGGCNTCGSSPVGTYPGTVVPPPCCSSPLSRTAAPVVPGTPVTPTELPKVMEKAKDPKGIDATPADPKGTTPKSVPTAPDPKPIDPKGMGSLGVPPGPRRAGPVVLPPLSVTPTIGAIRPGSR